MGLRASSLEGGFGLTPLTYVVVGKVTVENAALVDTGVQTLVSAEHMEYSKGQEPDSPDSNKVSNQTNNTHLLYNNTNVGGNMKR